MQYFADLVISGLAIGAIYGLIGMGYACIYKATGVVNFAQGEVMMLITYVTASLLTLTTWPFWMGLVLAPAVGILVGIVVERVVIRPMIGRPSFAIVMVTLGLGYLLRSLVTMVPGWGTDSHKLTTPYTGQVLRLGDLVVSQEHVVIIAVTIVLIAALYLFFSGTRTGIAMQAASQNQMAAGYMGIPIRRLSTLIWAMSAAVAAIAGILLAPLTFVHAQVGLIGIKAFPAAVLGGFGSMPGAIVGGLILGICESLAGFYLPEGCKDVTAYSLLLAALVFWPQGLFGQSVRKKV